MSLRWGALLRLTSCCFAFGRQDPAGQPPDATFRSDIKLIQVSVIAQDKHGKPVADLRREDFRLLDNGSAREIRLFVAERSDSNPQPESKTPGVFTNRMASPGGSRGGYSIILIDNLSTDFVAANRDDTEEGGGFGVQMALRTLRSISPGERIAVYAMEPRKVDVICEFTADRDLVERQLRKWKASVDTPKLAAEILAGDTLSPYASTNAAAVEHAYEGVIRQGAQHEASSSDEEMTQIADHLAGVPGRKTLIWLSNRFAIGPRAIRKLNGASVAIYPVDLAGVCVCPGVSTCGSCPPRPIAWMDGIAARTGGVAYYGRNDLDVAIRQAMDDGRISYTLGFYRADDDRASQVHQIAVKVTRPGLTLRYRTSYEAEAPQSTPAAKGDLVKALNRPIDATAVSIRAAAARAGDRLDVQAVVDVATLDLTEKRDRWAGRIEIAARFMGADGKQAGEVVSQTLNLSLSRATYETVLRQGIAYHNALKIPVKAVELKLLFANPSSGRTGTLTIPLSDVAAGSNLK